MNLLCVIDSFIQGGAQRQLVNVACELKKRGHRVEFFVYHRDEFFRKSVDRAAIPVRLCLKNGRFSMRPILEFRKVLRQCSFSHVLAFLETPCLYAELACLGLKGVRLVVSERNICHDGKVTPARLIKALLHQRADAVTTNSHAHAAWLAKAFPWLKDRITTIYNGVDLEEFRPREICARDGQLRLLGLGRIAEQKNIPRLARAVGMCRSEKRVVVRVDWAGRMDEDCALQSANEAIQASQLGTHWRWLGERNNIAELMHQYDALILPSLWEGLPNAVCEALASGLPVLASRVSDNPRLVQNGATGFLFDSEDTKGMADVIALFAGLPAEARACMGVEARAFAKRELSIAKCAAAYEAILEEAK